MNAISRNSCITLKTLLLATALALCLLAAPLPAPASAVLIIKDADIKPYRDAVQGFKETCGCSVRVLDLSDMGALEQAVKAHPDAVFTVGTRAFRKSKLIRNAPLIYSMVMPSETADALGENVSGVSMDIAPATGLAAMTGLFPGAKRIGVLFNADYTGPFVREASAAAGEMGLSLIMKAVRDPREAPALLEELRNKVDVLWMLPDAMLVNAETIDCMLLFSFQHSIPVFSFSKKYVEMGAVAALTIDPGDMGRQAGEMARSLIEGKQGPLRAYARSPRLIVNAKVGAKLGVRLNDELVRNAEKVE